MTDTIKWERLEAYDGYYINKLGQIRSKRNASILKTSNEKRSVDIYVDGKKCSRFIEGIIVQHIQPKVYVSGFYTVTYRDNNKQNLEFDNIIIEALNVKNWKQFRDTYYYANVDGQVWNFETKHYILPNTTKEKYLRMYLSGYKKLFNVHVIIAEVYLGPKPDGYVVDHISNDPHDNRLENLRYLTFSQNSQASVDRRKGIKSEKATSDTRLIINENEVFKQIEDTDYMISDHGNIKNIKTGLVRKIVPCKGYARFEHKAGNKRTAYNIHALVAKYFISAPPTTKYVINHKDRNKLNNHFSNLEYCTFQENTIHAIGKAIQQYTMDGKWIATFQSLSLAAKECGLKNSGSIWRCAKGKQKSGDGYIWKYAD